MKPDRIQIVTEIGKGQGPMEIHIVKHYPVRKLHQASILAGVFSDLVEGSATHLDHMTIKHDSLTVVFVVPAGAPLAEDVLGLIDEFDSIYDMVMEEQGKEEDDDVDDLGFT